jgi:hypothetical protein
MLRNGIGENAGRLHCNKSGNGNLPLKIRFPWLGKTRKQKLGLENHLTILANLPYLNSTIEVSPRRSRSGLHRPHAPGYKRSYPTFFRRE